MFVLIWVVFSNYKMRQLQHYKIASQSKACIFINSLSAVSLLMFLQNVLKHKEEPMKRHEQTTSFLENVNVVQEMWAVLVTCYSLS